MVIHSYKSQIDELYEVTDFKALADYTLQLTFNDGAKQEINFEPILYGPMFGPLREQELFNGVKLDSELGTLVWPTGADIDPTVLHDWPNHVEAIIERRQKQFVATATD